MLCSRAFAIFLVLSRFGIAYAELNRYVSSSDFNSIISSNGLVMVAFLHEASDASKHLLAEYELAASALEQPLMTVDCGAERALCHGQDISAYPAVRAYKGSSLDNIRYRGPRTARSIVSFLTKQSLPQMSSVTDTNHTSFKQIDDTVFIAFLGASDTELISLYTEAAQAFHESFAFGLSVAPSLAASENIEPPAVVSYQNTNDHSSALTGAFDILSLQDFIHSSSTPFIGQLTRRSMDNYLSLRKPILYIFLPRHPPSLNSTSNDDLLRALGSTARVYGPYVSFVHIDAVDYAHMAPALELRPNIWPAVVMHDVVRDRVWVYPQDDEVEAGKVEALVLGVLKGEIEPTPPGAGRETIEENGEGGALAHDEL